MYMHIGDKIRSIIDANEVNVTDFAKGINRSREYVYTILKKENIDTGLLQEIARVLSVPVVCFFDEEAGNQEGVKKMSDNVIRQNHLDSIMKEPTEKSDDSILYKLYKEKDAEASALSEEVGRLKLECKILNERFENLNAQITLNKSSSGSHAVESAKNVNVPGREKATL